jgi:dihydrofolate reductase
MEKAKGFIDRKLANYVFSRQAPPDEVVPGVTFVSEDVKAFAGRLRATPGKDIWMMGGGALIASFLDVGEIDEFDIHVIPVFIGEGIPLVAPRYRDIELRLLDSTSYPDGVVRLRYAVER